MPCWRVRHRVGAPWDRRYELLVYCSREPSSGTGTFPSLGSAVSVLCISRALHSAPGTHYGRRDPGADDLDSSLQCDADQHQLCTYQHDVVSPVRQSTAKRTVTSWSVLGRVL